MVGVWEFMTILYFQCFTFFKLKCFSNSEKNVNLKAPQVILMLISG